MQNKSFGEWNPVSLQQHSYVLSHDAEMPYRAFRAGGLEINVDGSLTAERDGVPWDSLAGWGLERADHRFLRRRTISTVLYHTVLYRIVLL